MLSIDDEVEIMENINSVVADNLKRLREERKLSLEALAKLSRVSKSMLGQIERGEANPTVSTVWKIAGGLKVSFTELMTRPEKNYEVVDIRQVDPLLEDEGRYRNFPVFSFDAERRFEMLYIEIDPGGRLEAEAHPAGTQEFITAFSGELSVFAGGEIFSLARGFSLRFKADGPHSYQNTGSEVCRLSMVIYYPE